jgi:AmmeMemoRadiSam system protein A
MDGNDGRDIAKRGLALSTPVFACIAPHAPILIPAVGRGQERTAQATTDGFGALRDALAAAEPDVLVIFCPHGPVSRDTFHVLTGALQGDLRRFRASDVQFDHPTDTDFAASLLDQCRDRGIAATAVEQWEPHDHSVWVPLYFLREAAPRATVVLISISFASPQAHFALGEAIADVIAAGDKRVAIIASADGAHALKDDGPYGFHPAAPRFEAALHTAIDRWDVPAVLAFDDETRRLAAEDSVPSVSMLMGALAKHDVTARILSAEGPWGVGYTTALLTIRERPGHPQQPTPTSSIDELARAADLVGLARAAVENYVRDGKRNSRASAIDAALENIQAATFVSIHDKSGALRGCIGTLRPTQSSVGGEIVANAIAAATRDPRFEPVQRHELAGLAYKVDVLTEPQPIDEPSLLDPKQYGVIVEAGDRRGVLLPDLAGIDTIDAQVRIAREKGGIGRDETVQLYRFSVRRFSE